MKNRWLLSLGAVATVGAVAWLAATLESQRAEPDPWTVARMPWGHPDLEGIWDSKTITAMERPAAYAGRTFLTDEEVASLERQAEARFSTAIENAAGITLGGDRAERGTARDVAQAYSPVFISVGTTYVRTKRTSLVIDPTDGRIPYSSDGRDKVAAEAAYRKALAAADLRLVVDMADGPEDRPNDRCLGFVLPCTSFQCAMTRIVQGPRSVAIYYEGGHVGGAYRTIPLDGRAHLPSHIREWYGDSVGYWEGDTLVVDTHNFTDWRSGNLTTAPLGFRGNGEQFRLVERFTRVASDMILYRVSIENPVLYASPWTIEMPWIQASGKRNQIFESACHEGNIGLTGILAGARALEKETARRLR
jgi:hypothetical protein